MTMSHDHLAWFGSLYAWFSLRRLHAWGGKALMGGLMRGGDIDLMGEPNFDRFYHKLKVLLMLSSNYTMQFIGYDSSKTRWFIFYCFQAHSNAASIQKNWGDNRIM